MPSMTTVSTTRAPQIESWMVPKLFATSTPDKIDGPVKDQSTASLSSAKMSGATSEAIGKLKQGGVPERQSAAVSNAIVKRLNAMTSDDITEAMYSGKGLTFAGGLVGSPNTIFASIMKNYTDTTARERQWADNDQYTADQRQQSAALASHMKSLTATLQKAFDDKTLVFHKASDIKGLDFKENIQFNDDLNAPSKGAADYNINSTFLTDNHLEDHLVGAPGITLFMTW